MDRRTSFATRKIDVRVDLVLLQEQKGYSLAFKNEVFLRARKAMEDWVGRCLMRVHEDVLLANAEDRMQLVFPSETKNAILCVVCAVRVSRCHAPKKVDWAEVRAISHQLMNLGRRNGFPVGFGASCSNSWFIVDF